MTHFPVIKDLVVDMQDFMEKLVKIKPWIIREKETPPEQGEYKQSAKELERYSQFSSCINCMLCYAACPIYGLNEKFLGPAATAPPTGTLRIPETKGKKCGSRVFTKWKAWGGANSSVK